MIGRFFASGIRGLISGRAYSWEGLLSEFVQKAFLVGSFSGELIFGGTYYWRAFCASK